MADHDTTTTTPTPEGTPGPEAGDARCKGRGRRHRGRRAGFLALSILALAAAIGFALPHALAARGHGGWGHGEITAEHVQERLDRMVERLASRVDATPEQEAALKEALAPAAAQALALRKAARAVGDRFEAALGRDAVDPAEVEALRQEMVRLADEGTRALTDAVLRVDGVLTPDQRKELVEDLSRMRKWHRR